MAGPSLGQINPTMVREEMNANSMHLNSALRCRCYEVRWWRIRYPALVGARLEWVRPTLEWVHPTLDDLGVPRNAAAADNGVLCDEQSVVL